MIFSSGLTFQSKCCPSTKNGTYAMVIETASVPLSEGISRQAEADMGGLEDANDVSGPQSGDSDLRKPLGNHKHFAQEDQPETDSLIKAHKYYITRERDDLIIAVWTDAERSSLSANSESSVEAINDLKHHSPSYSDSEFRDPRTMTLAHHRGDRFDIPWILCKKWAWMKEVIKLTYGSDDDAKRSVDEGRFELIRDDLRILANHWDKVAEPWQFITIRLESQGAMGFDLVNVHGTDNKAGTATESKATSSDPNGATTIYQTTVKYRIDFYLRGTTFHENSTFVESKTYDNAPAIKKSSSSGHLVPVIEEINSITFASETSTCRKDYVPKHGLVLDADDKVKPKKLLIRSILLLNALRSIVKYSSIMPTGEDTEVFTDGLFPFPFKDLYHHREELLKFQKQTDGFKANHSLEHNAECNRHIDILIDYLDNEPTVQLRSVKERWAQKVPTTTFAGFWLLMKPGADVYIREYGQLNAYVVDVVYGGINYDFWSFSAISYNVQVWHLVYDGKVVKRRSKMIQVHVFDGERDITSLPLFPTSFHDRLDNGALRKQLIERGMKFFRYARGPTFLEYTGTGLKPGWKRYNKARVVVEHESLPWLLPEFSSRKAWDFNRNEDEGSVSGIPLMFGLGARARAPQCECSECKTVDGRRGTYISPTFSDYDHIDPNREEGLSGHQALVCMSHMFGFILKDRAYDILDLNSLSQPTLADSAIDELVLRPEKNKDIIKAIARTYTESDSQADLFSVDFIRGKGEGQIFLLHGPPGTGKTLTAESIAEYTKRPLLSITTADLGHEPVELERKLLQFFKNATAWDAIVLLDEADIYLERRSTNDLRRNSIVSIFLRALDYFQGILFFTTNRVGQFDEAFMSRIHVAIGYDQLDDKAREQIWDTFFRKLKENHKCGGPRIDYEYDAKQYVRKSDDVKRLQWNGREIRNAFQTAVALAIADSKTAREKGRLEEDCIPQVTEAHLSHVVHMSSAFKRYIRATHEGIDESDLAYRLGNRHDGLEPESR